MPNYKARFDEQTPAALQALNAKGTEFQNSFYGTHVAYVRRLIERISAALQKVDDNKINHPVFLAGSGQPLPDKAIQLISSMPSSINDSGITHFINQILPQLVAIDEGLSKAIGINEIRAAEIKSSQLRAIERYVDWSKNSYNQVQQTSTAASEASSDIKKIKTELDALATEAKSDGKKVQEIRATASRLSSGTKTTPSLSAIIKEAQDKLGQIEAKRADAATVLASIEEAQTAVEASETSADEAMKRLELHDTRANDILRNATQAGLAGAFRVERDKLAKQQLYFAIAFYGIIALVVAYAAIFIVPIASQIILKHENESVTAGESALLLFVRILIVLPAFWALVFTNRRFVYLETLQMDYAAKAVTALAYSGYKDELSADPKLSTRLRDGLVTRFVEHPSRLLGKKVESSISITGDEGSQVVTESHSPESAPINLTMPRAAVPNGDMTINLPVHNQEEEE